MLRLLLSNPKRHYKRTATNFARGEDAKTILMSAVEISTGIGRTVEEVIEDLKSRRAELAQHCNLLCVPVGNLFQLTARTNTAGLHLHLGGGDSKKIYHRLAWFLPLLMRYNAHAPVAGNSPSPPSWRMANSYAIGDLDGTYTRRFQDLIIARRLGTVEIRVFDPHPDLDLLQNLFRLVRDISSLQEDFPLDLSRYAGLREKALQADLHEDILDLEKQLNQRVNNPFSLEGHLPYQQTLAWFQNEGIAVAYARLDGWWRTGQPQPSGVPIAGYSYPKALMGFMGYYLPRLPYTLVKAYLENRK